MRSYGANLKGIKIRKKNFSYRYSKRFFLDLDKKKNDLERLKQLLKKFEFSYNYQYLHSYNIQRRNLPPKIME